MGQALESDLPLHMCVTRQAAQTPTAVSWSLSVTECMLFVPSPPEEFRCYLKIFVSIIWGQGDGLVVKVLASMRA